MLNFKKPLTLFTLLVLSSCGKQAVQNNAFTESTQTLQFSKLDCGLDEGLTVAQRISDCGNVEKHLSTGQVMKLVALRAGQDEVLSTEYYQDAESGLVWETENNAEASSREEAYKICKEKNDLNLRWRLPNINEFLKLGNKDNSQDHNLTVAEVFTNIYTYGTASFWTCSEIPYMYFRKKPVLFKNIQALAASSDDYKPHKTTVLVQCVATEPQ
jgi:hypothetical protein